jgi:hypothetical protein
MQYWAAKSTSEIGCELAKRVDDYYEHILKFGILSRWRRAYRSYYGLSQNGQNDTTAIGSAGDEGEYRILKVNHLRNVGLHILSFVTSQRPALECTAINTDRKSQAQSVLGKGLIDYYLKHGKLEMTLGKAAEKSIVYAEAFTELGWNANTGKEYGVEPDTGAVLYDGDLEHRALGPIDVIRDAQAFDGDVTPWLITRHWINKYDLAARHPEYAKEITYVDGKPDVRRSIITITKSETDLIPYYRFYHQPTPALPNGRLTEFLDDGLTLIDGDLPYGEIPVYRVTPSDWLETIFGYTPIYDLLGIQQAVDSLYSTVFTNQSNFGVSNVLCPRGANISVKQIAEGLNLIEYDPKLGEIKALNLTQTPPEIFSFIKLLVADLETLSGVNSVTRGNPEASLKSGAALALVASQAIQFASSLQQSYYGMIEKSGTGVINILKAFAKTPRVALIAGKYNRSLMKEFVGDDLSNISRVVTEVVNPLARTAAGRRELAKDMIQANLIRRPEEYLSVITTGNLEPLYENEEASLLLIRAENELLTNGQKPVAVITDDHRLHILEHRTVLDSPEARQNPQLVQNATLHLQEHLNLLRTADPALLMLLGQQPVPPPMPSPAAPGGASIMDATNPVIQEAQGVKLPAMPQMQNEQTFIPQGGN